MSLINGLVNQTIDSIVTTTSDGYGDKTQTTIYENVPCRWQDKIERITNNNNEEVTTTVKVWLLPSYSGILYTYQILQNSVTYNIQLIDNNYDLDGELDHIVLYLL